MSTLYDLATEYQMMADQLLDVEELDDQCLADTLESLSGTFQHKALNVAKFVKNAEASAVMIRAAVVQMEKRAMSLEKVKDRVQAYLKGQMERTGILKIECPYFALRIKKNPPSVEITDEAAVPAEYWMQPPAPPPRVDKSFVKEVLRVQPDKVPGARLVQGTRLEIK